MDDYSDVSSDYLPTNGTVVRVPSSSKLARQVANSDEDLCWPSTGTKVRKKENKLDAQKRLDKIAGAVETILECIGEDKDREGLLKTPMRYAKALMFFTKGYEQSLNEIVNEAVFQEDYDDMVLVRNITIHSLCEHHLVPFWGTVEHFIH